MAKQQTRLPYDVVFVGMGPRHLPPIEGKSLIELKRALKKEPSPTFLEDMALALWGFPPNRTAVKSASPAAIQKRLKDVQNTIIKLAKAVDALKDTDRGIIFNVVRASRGEATEADGWLFEKR